MLMDNRGHSYNMMQNSGTAAGVTNWRCRKCNPDKTNCYTTVCQEGHTFIFNGGDHMCTAEPVINTLCIKTSTTSLHHHVRKDKMRLQESFLGSHKPLPLTNEQIITYILRQLCGRHYTEYFQQCESLAASSTGLKLYGERCKHWSYMLHTTMTMQHINRSEGSFFHCQHIQPIFAKLQEKAAT